MTSELEVLEKKIAELEDVISKKEVIIKGYEKLMGNLTKELSVVKCCECNCNKSCECC